MPGSSFTPTPLGHEDNLEKPVSVSTLNPSAQVSRTKPFYSRRVAVQLNRFSQKSIFSIRERKTDAYALTRFYYASSTIKILVRTSYYSA
ncbi:hypothetical protein TNCV_2214161 [Trichonephila clavipes]|nr:hypothetical protein TNCV_2214161 [Trichonephila clavipes]